jgi:hypothetical protein
MDSGFRRNDGFWTFDETIKLDQAIDKIIEIIKE